MAAGGAATGLPVLQFFEDIGVPIMEGYGLTETSPMISAGTYRPALLCRCWFAYVPIATLSVGFSHKLNLREHCVQYQPSLILHP
jgi:acyl-CoA synthetase (AMP-forming)/AMP-acid ligase II